MDNSFPNSMEGNKASSSSQAVYKCGLCGKEYVYYRDLALHERAHLNQMGLAGSVPRGTLPPYGSRVVSSNAQGAPTASLDSFEKLTRPFHREQQASQNSDPRLLNQNSPVPTPSLDQDKVPRQYRNDSENRNVMDTRSPVPNSRNVTTDARALPVEPRSMSLGTRNVQSPDMRTAPPSNVHTLAYSSSQYIDNVASTLYSSMNNKYPPATTLGAYTTPPVSHSTDYFPVDSRNQLLSKLGSQVYSKSDSYCPADKSHYSNIPEKPHSVYVTSHYTVGKVLAQQPEPYYTSSPHSTPAHAKYETEKITSTPTVTTYYSPQGLSTEGGLKQDVRSAGPKSTLYYGPQETTFLPTPVSNIPYHMTVTKPQESSNTYIRETVNKLPERPIANRPYPGGHVSPHLPYSDLYKGSHLQPQVFSSVPAQISQSHVDYNSYKPAAEPVPSVNLHIEGNQTVRQYPLEYTCHVCQLPCSNSHELSEHMKIHAMAQSASLPHFVPQSTTVSGSYNVSEPSLKQHTSPENNFASSTSSFSVYNSKDNLASLKMSYLEEHKKSQVNLEEYQFHCKTCDKFFSSSAKYKRHESQHKRNASFLSCEFCMASFEQKGQYLHHMTKKHGPPHASTNIVESSGKHLHSVSESSSTSSSSSLLVDLVNIVDCQICDLEVYRDKLVEHLSTHPLFMCRICDGMFVQNSELVEHLMKQHSKELERSDSNRNKSETDRTVPSGASNIAVQRVKLDEEDSGLEEDKDDETREPIVKTTGPKNVETGETGQVKSSNESTVKDDSFKGVNGSEATTEMKDSLEKSQSEKGLKRKSISGDESNDNVVKKVKKVEMKNLKENLQKKIEEDKVVPSNKELVKSNEKTSVSDKTKSEDRDISDLGINKKKLKFRCSKCDKSFAKHGDLVQHVEVHNKDPSRIYCEVCDLSYHIKEKGYYMYHMKYHKDVEMVNSHHPAQLSCVVCNKEIKKQVLVSHIVNQHTQFSCDICQWSYSSEKSLLTHMKRIHGQRYKQLKDMKKVVKDKPLPIVYRKLKELKAEEQAEKNSEKQNKQDEQAAKVTYTCEVCSKTLVSKSFFEKHVLKHKLTAEEQQVACDLCQLTFPSKGTYFFHILKDHTKSTISESQGQSDEHIKSDEGGGANFQPCTDSQVNNITNSQIQNVRQIVRTVLNPETGFFEEKLVDEPESEMNVIDKLNEKTTGGIKNEKTDLKDKVNVKDVIYCKLCNRSLNKSSLLDHMNSHTFYHCDACKFTYTKQKPYLHHIKVLHVEQFIEDEIEKMKLLEKTPTDKRRRSETTRLMSCPLCSGEFRQNAYIEHVKTHLPQSWSCQFCSQRFSKKKLLSVHEKSHERICHSSLPYPMYCPSCNAAMNSRQTYVEHMCGHLKKTPFKCKFCDEKFLYEKGGDCHMRVQHCTNGRIFWKLDGEGVKFDVRTGRIFEVTSDYITEIREINDLLKLNGKPEIWISSPQKKKDKMADSHKWKSTDDESDERLKTDTSDDEYTPGTRKSLRKRDSLNEKSSSNDDDSSDSSDDSSDDSSSDDSSDDSSSDDDSSESSEDEDKDEDKDEERDKEEETSTSRQPNGSNSAELSADSESENEMQSPRTRSRQQTRKNSFETRRRSPRIKISSPKVTGTRSSPRRAGQKAKLNESDDKQETEKRKLVESESTTRTRRAKVARTSTSRAEENTADDTVKTPSKCPCCSQRFTSERNLSNHIKSSHKSYRARKERLSGNLHGTPASGQLKTRTRNLRSDLAEPCSTSTPLRQGRAIVKISPLNLDDSESKVVKISSPITTNKRFKFCCPYCKKGFTNNKWNFSRHVETHKKDKAQQGGKSKNKGTSKKLNDSKPFSCKVCSESFQKKRDLYIHAKIHLGDQGDNSATNNGKVKDVGSAVKENAVSSVNTTNSSDTSTVNISQGESVLEDRSDGKSDVNISNIVEQNHSKVEILDKHEKVTPGGVGKQKDNDEIVKNDRVLDDEKVDNIEKSNGESKDESDIRHISEHVGEQKELLPKSENKAGTNDDVHSVNNNVNVNNKEENDSADRSKLTRTVPPKMSSEAALAKWKSKVAATLSSQLELHATKLQQELENPEAAKIKDFLSKSGKPERRGLECRICGDMFEKEDKFREHMNIHLNQSPPYCGLCNMYFMAIYPIRRLLEHNKKKHPDLLKTVTSEKPH